MITVDDLACNLRVCTKTVRRWIQRYPDMPVYRLGTDEGSPYRFLYSEVLAWFRELRERELAPPGQD